MTTIDLPELGVLATVVMDYESHAPTVIDYGPGEGLREIDVDEYWKIGPVLVDEISIVSAYTLHVALYGLQQGDPASIEQALGLIGMSGDLEEHIDHDTMLPLPVPPPNGWEKQ